MKISKYLSLTESTRSQTAQKLGLANEPNAEQLENMKHLGVNVFDPIREFVGGPLAASSFFRHPDVNSAVGGSRTSDHANGEAIDVTTQWYKVDKTNADVFHYIKDNLKFDQLIWEFGDDNEPDWVHVSLRRLRPNRGIIMKAVRIHGKVKYLPYK